MRLPERQEAAPSRRFAFSQFHSESLSEFERREREKRDRMQTRGLRVIRCESKQFGHMTRGMVPLVNSSRQINHIGWQFPRTNFYSFLTNENNWYEDVRDKDELL